MLPPLATRPKVSSSNIEVAMTRHLLVLFQPVLPRIPILPLTLGSLVKSPHWNSRMAILAVPASGQSRRKKISGSRLRSSPWNWTGRMTFWGSVTVLTPQALILASMVRVWLALLHCSPAEAQFSFKQRLLFSAWMTSWKLRIGRLILVRV